MNQILQFFLNVFGDGPVNGDTDWTSKVPPFDSQYSADTHTDVEDCTAESFCHIYFMLTGVRVSPRALAVMAHLEDPNNRSVAHIVDTVNAFGLVLWDDCPTPDDFTMSSYYQPLTAAEDKPFPVKVKLVPPDLDVSPLWTEIAWGLNLPVVTRHMVAQINTTEYFDSEEGGPIKPLNFSGGQAVYQTSLIVTKPMTIAFKQQNDPTYYVQVGSVLVPLADPQALTNIGGTLQNVVELTPQQFALFTLGDHTLFKSS